MASPYRGADSQNIPIRPLSKGMVRDIPGQTAPLESLRTIDGYIAGQKGLTRELGFKKYAGGEELVGTFVDMITLWQTDGSQVTFLMTTDYLYKVGTLTGYSRIPWPFDESTFYSSGIAVTTSVSDLEGNWVRIGDELQVAPTNDLIVVDTVEDIGGSLGGTYFYVDDEFYVWIDVDGGSVDPAPVGYTGIEVDIGSGDNADVVASAIATAVDGNVNFDADNYASEGKVVIRRASSHDMSSAADVDTGFTITHQDEILDYSDPVRITDVGAGTITLEEVLAEDYPKLTNMRVLRSFKAQKPSLVDWVVGNDELVIASKEVPLLVYNDSTDELELFISSSSNKINYGAGGIDFTCECVTYFKDRLWVGHTIDGTDGEKRQRIRWSTTTNFRDFSDLTAYYDIPYVSGTLKRLIPMGNILVAYFDDAVYFGTSSNIRNLPLVFQEVNTGGNGLVGQKAVTTWLNGHFFVGQDDIYYLSNKGPERIGSPVIDLTIGEAKELWRTYVAIDPVRYRVVFGFPIENEYMERLWSYEYRSGSWSYRSVQTWMIANPNVNVEFTWDDITITWDEFAALDLTWDELVSKTTRRQFYVEYSNILWRLDEVPTLEFEDNGVNTVVETHDIDFNEPDRISTVSRISLKIDRTDDLEENLVFSVKASSNRGRKWRPLGQLVIRSGFDEGYVNFRLTGSTVRFKLESSSEVTSYSIVEMVLKAVRRGKESDLGAQE